MMPRPDRIPVPLFPAWRAAWIACGGITLGTAGLFAQPAVAPAVAPAPAAEPAAEAEPEAVIYLRDGQEFTGQLIAQADNKVVLRIAGIVTTFNADQVERIRVLPSVMERYKALREAIDDNDSEQILRLADWLVERKRFDLAIAELKALIARQPQSGPAKRQLATVEKMAAMRDRRDAARAAARAGGDRPEAAAPVTAPAIPLLTEPQIALMKVYEVDLAAKPRVVVPPEVSRRLFEEHGGNPAVPQTPEGRDALLRRPGYELLDVIFAARARELYPLVKVVDQPEGLRRFRDDVLRNWLANSCATSQCHGGADAGRLVLVNRALGTDPTVYTNFWIMSRYRLAGGAPLIDWENPGKSPLLQLGLPRTVSTTPHPPVPRGPGGRELWKPVFLSDQDHRFAATVAWIQSMYRPRPDYALEYAPFRPFDAPSGPVPGPTTGPASGPIGGPPVVERPAPPGNGPVPR